jgi:prepilin-type processing-associated H-X9-DG protein
LGVPPGEHKPEHGIFIQPTFRNVTDGLSQTMLVREVAGRPDSWWNSAHNPDIDGPWLLFEVSSYGASASLRIQVAPRELYNHYFMLTTHHPTGAHVLMCDGSTRLLGIDTHVEVISAMATARIGDRGDIPLEEFLKGFLSKPPRRPPPGGG